MFRELYAVARHTPMTLIVTPHGDQLKVIVIPKPGDDAPKESALHKPLSFLGTPEELDTFSAEAIEQIGAYATGTNALREKLDLPIAAVNAEAEATPTFPARASSTTPKSKGGQAATKRAAKKKAKAAKPAPARVAPKKEKKAVPASTDQRVNQRKIAESVATPDVRDGRSAGAHHQRSDGPDTPAGSVTASSSASQPVQATGQGEPGSHQSPADSPAPSARPSAEKPPRHPDLPPRLPKIDRASKEQCIEDGKAYLVAIGAAKPSRELFCRWALTGRRYEKLWDNFAAFLAEVRGETSSTDQREPAAQGLPAKASTEVAAHREGTAHSQGKPDEPAPGASRSTAAPSETDAQQLVQTGSLPIETQRTTLSLKQAWPFPVAKEEDWQVVAPKQKPASTIRSIVTDTGIVLSATALTYGIGDKYSHVEFGDYRVIATEPTRYIVTAWTDEVLATKPTNNGDLLEGLASTQGA